MTTACGTLYARSVFILEMLIPSVVLLGQQTPSPKPAVVDVRVGAGRAVHAGDRVTVHISAKTVDGKTLVDTQKRGLAYSFEFSLTPSEPWQKEVAGMKQGGVRKIKMEGKMLGLKQEPTLIVTVRLVSVVPAE